MTNLKLTPHTFPLVASGLQDKNCHEMDENAHPPPQEKTPHSLRVRKKEEARLSLLFKPGCWEGEGATGGNRGPHQEAEAA